MKSKLKILFAFIISFTFFSCSNPTDSSINFLAGNYSYTAYDSLGTIITQGNFSLNFNDSKSIYGEWHFNMVNNPENIGPQYGDGKFIGEYNEGKLWMELNPDYRDNNVVLFGSINSETYIGKWNYSTFIGLTNYGFFEAVKIN